MAAQGEALLAVYNFVLEANPRMIFSDRRADAEKALNIQAAAWSEALINLSKAYGKTESEQ